MPSLFEVMGKLIGAGKHASPVTLKTFFVSEPPIGELTVPQYLGRLAAAATSIINTQAYGRVIYDLAVRRELIVIGEDMVNVAYDLPVDAPPEAQIEEAEQRLYDIADKGKYGSGFMPSATPRPTPSRWRPRPMSAKAGCRACPRASRTSTE